MHAAVDAYMQTMQLQIYSEVPNLQKFSQDIRRVPIAQDYFFALPFPFEGPLPRAASLIFASRASIWVLLAFSASSRSSFSA